MDTTALGRATASALHGGGLRALADRALGRTDPATGLPRMRAFLRHGEAMLQRCRNSRQPVSLAVFNAGEVVHDASLDPDLVAHYTAAVIECLRAAAGSVGLLARTGSAEFSVLMPLANERVARRMIAHEFGQLKARIAAARGGRSAEVVLAPPACAVFGITGTGSSLAQWHCEASLEVQEISAFSRRLSEEEEMQETRPVAPEGQACDGALVAMEVDAAEWIRANEHPTTIHAPLPRM